MGFITADAIARNLGIAPDSEFRYRAGKKFILWGKQQKMGIVSKEQAELVEQAKERLKLADHQPHQKAIATLIYQMGIEDELVMQGHRQHQFICYQKPFYHAEENLAHQLQELLSRPLKVDAFLVSNWIERYAAATNTTLSQAQQEAVEMAARERILVLTGGPGTGKTFTTRTIVALWKAMGKSIALAAPTRSAAQRSD